MSAKVPVELQLESDTLVSWPLIGQVWEFPNSDHAHFSCNDFSDWTRKRVLPTVSAHRVLQGQTLSSIIHTFFPQYKTLWFALWIITSRWHPMGVNIATRCLRDHSTWDATWLYAWKNLLSRPNQTWKTWCLKWHRLRDSIVKNWKKGGQFRHFYKQMSTYQNSHCQMNTRKLWSCIDNHKSSMWQCMSMPHIPLVVKVWLDSLNRKVMGDNGKIWFWQAI